jgi:pyruvate dehydrogenase E2 component (dihydrolipoamide acetyltransferase)
MAKILEMPKLSPTMEEGVLSLWHKKEGDALAVDDLLAEVETDKATMEFRAFDAGILLRILVSAGSQVKLGQAVAIVGAAGEDVTALLDRIGAPAAAAVSPRAPLVPAPDASLEGESNPPPTNPTPPNDTLPPPAQRNPPVANILDRTAHWPETVSGPRRAPAGDRVLASPYVRKLARDLGIELHGAVGTGPGGRVVATDLQGLQSRPPASPLAKVPATPATTGPGTGNDSDDLRPHSPMRKAIARRLVESKTTIPHFYLSVDVNAAPLVALREQINTDIASTPSLDKGVGAPPVKVSYNDLVIKACAIALARVPECNASYTPDAIRIHNRIHISVAVAIADGLVTPVVRDADRKTLVSIATEVRELAARARARKLTPEEMQGGTFSITNLGMFGIDAFSAVINPPEGAILAVGAIRDVPVVADGLVVAGKRIHLTLSCDHRVVDGAVGAAFLSELRHLIEHPMRTLAG